jgi:predicted metalloprotease with PDZ domain
MRLLSACVTFFFLLFQQPLFAQTALTYTVDLNKRADDLFHVQLEVTDLKPENDVYQFAATAPGTYQVMDIGRFVRSFEALDSRGKKLPVEKVSINQWRLGDPAQTRTIKYTIAETWDTKVKEHPVYLMCGTSLEKDHALINGQGVFGFPQGMQNRPLRIKLRYPKSWKAGTALEKDPEGFYQARSFDHMVDSPILLGRLTEASTTIGETQVNVHCYSKTDLIKAPQLLGNMQQMLKAAQAFLVELPVKRYAFLFHFEDYSNGAWEHSYSSEYVLKEEPLTPDFAASIVTPLNIHSEVIEQFNFVQPTGSEHLWLYEGVTEWASDMMQLRSGMISMEQYLLELQQKIEYDHQVDTTYSLSKLGLTSFSDSGQAQYGNIYNRGAVTAALLDLRLLELSGGKRGLREVINELARTYGPSRSFPEKDFFSVFTRSTYPEIADFFNRYIRNAEALPIAGYFSKIGVTYRSFYKTGRMVPTLGMGFTVNPDNVTLVELSDSAKTWGISGGDQFLSYAGQQVSPDNIRGIVSKIKSLSPGSPYRITIFRNGEKKDVLCRVLQKEQVFRYQFTVDSSPTPEQKMLRDVWLRNL